MLELKNISFGVSDESAQKEILKDISLVIEDNQFIVVTGPESSQASKNRHPAGLFWMGRISQR